MLLSVADRSSQGSTVKENAEFARKGGKKRSWREHGLLLERRTGSVNGGMLEKLWTKKDKSDAESLFAGKMETRISNF